MIVAPEGIELGFTLFMVHKDHGAAQVNISGLQALAPFNSLNNSADELIAALAPEYHESGYRLMTKHEIAAFKEGVDLSED